MRGCSAVPRELSGARAGPASRRPRGAPERGSTGLPACTGRGGALRAEAASTTAGPRRAEAGPCAAGRSGSGARPGDPGPLQRAVVHAPAPQRREQQKRPLPRSARSRARAGLALPPRIWAADRSRPGRRCQSPRGAGAQLGRTRGARLAGRALLRA